MWRFAVEFLLAGLGLYALAGVLFAVPFCIRGAAEIDPAAQEASWGFRVAILPGVVALWPWMARRWWTRSRRRERNAHRDLAERAAAR